MVLLRFCNVDTVNLMFGDRLTGNHNVHHHYHCPEHRFPGPNDHSDGGSGGGADGGDQPPPSNGPSPPPSGSGPPNGDSGKPGGGQGGGGDGGDDSLPLRGQIQDSVPTIEDSTVGNGDRESGGGGGGGDSGEAAEANGSRASVHAEADLGSAVIPATSSENKRPSPSDGFTTPSPKRRCADLDLALQMQLDARITGTTRSIGIGDHHSSHGPEPEHLGLNSTQNAASSSSSRPSLRRSAPLTAETFELMMASRLAASPPNWRDGCGA